MCSRVQSLSAVTVQISLKGGEISGKICGELDVFTRGLRLVCLSLGAVEYKRENS